MELESEWLSKQSTSGDAGPLGMLMRQVMQDLNSKKMCTLTGNIICGITLTIRYVMEYFYRRRDDHDSFDSTGSQLRSSPSSRPSSTGVRIQ